MDGATVCGGVAYKDSVRALRRTEAGLLNRLKSIDMDSAWLQEEMLPLLSDADGAAYPVVANLRCGAWYLPPEGFAATAHFKSTDGHYGTWEFPTGRLNLNVVQLAEERGGVVLVDSTRKGKVYPDALLRTVPLWCAVMNRVKQAAFAGADGGDEFPADALSPSELPPQLPRSEAAQIARKVTSLFVGRARGCGVDWADVTLTLPLKCVHLCRATQTRDVLRLLAACDFTAYRYLFLVSVSAHAELVPRPSFTYVQGAGDDHQSWSCGLTPQLFWEHAEELLAAAPVECEAAAARIAAAHGASAKAHGSVSTLAAAALRVEIGGLGEPYRVYVSPEGTESDIVLGEAAPSTATPEGDAGPSGPRRLLVRDTSKKDLQLAIPELVAAARELLQAPPHSLTLSCATGCGPSVAACVAVIASLSSSGWVLDFPDAPPPVSKQRLRAILAKLTTYVTAAAPSRNVMKQLNRHFITHDAGAEGAP